MDMTEFLNQNNPNYQIKVIAPTHTYGVMNSLDSKYDFDINFDEYNPEGTWEYNIEVNGQTIATFFHLEDVKNYLVQKMNKNQIPH